MKKLLTISLLALGFAVGTASAQTVDFPPYQTNGYFSCTGANTNATVTISTSQVDVYGFCQGSPFVVQPGKVVGLPVSLLNISNFQFTKPLGDSSSVTVTTSDGSAVTCVPESQSGRWPYPGGSACLAATTK